MPAQAKRTECTLPPQLREDVELATDYLGISHDAFLVEAVETMLAGFALIAQRNIVERAMEFIAKTMGKNLSKEDPAEIASCLSRIEATESFKTVLRRKQNAKSRDAYAHPMEILLTPDVREAGKKFWASLRHLSTEDQREEQREIDVVAEIGTQKQALLSASRTLHRAQIPHLLGDLLNLERRNELLAKAQTVFQEWATDAEGAKATSAVQASLSGN